MDFLLFLHKLKESPNLPGIFLVLWYAPSYCPVFFSRLLMGKSVIPLDLHGTKPDDFRGQLDMTFLGTNSTYWLKDVSILNKTSKNIWIDYLLAYRGPNSVMLFDTDKPMITDTDTSLVIPLPGDVNYDLYNQLYLFLYPHYAQDKVFVTNLFKYHTTIPLDTACMLMAYQIVLGKKTDTFFAQWLTTVFTPKKSLFTLSQYLFAQQPKDFFLYWTDCKADYPDEFWIAFWSEHILQACLFIARAEKHGIIEAKRKALSLPFSFINKDWRRYTRLFLVNAHQSLYTLDYTLKNGRGYHGLELWYHKFLRGHFK
jgi:hypothetical protein